MEIRYRYFVCYKQSKLGRRLRRTYKVYYDGTIENLKGRALRRRMQIYRKKDGTVTVKTQIKLGGRIYTYDRVVYAAWNPHFDIEDLSVYVVPKNGNPHDHRVSNLVERTERRVSPKVLSDKQVLEIKTKHKEAGISYRNLANEYGVSLRVIQRVIKGEY